MEFRVLGPLDVRRHGRPVPLAGRKQRALLACLLLEANRVVSTDRLIDELWPHDPPESAAHALQVYVSDLRRVLGAARLVTRAPGYLMRVEERELDLLRFEQLFADGERAVSQRRHRVAAEKFSAALSVWRGPALDGIRAGPRTRADAARLDELRLTALEQRIDAELSVGRHRQLVPELEALVAQHPLRERLWAHLMLALYRAGRQADALAAYREAREHLAAELGLEPGPDLQALHKNILAQEHSLAPSPPPTSNLPAPVTSFIGRERDLAELTELLA